MLVKIIIVLILTIAVGVLGFSDIGEGVFNFVDKSAAAEFAEDARDLTQIVEIYNTDQQGTETAFVGAAITDSTVDATDGAADRQTLSDYLVTDGAGDFLKKGLSTDYEVIVDVATNDAYMRLAVPSVDVCSEINEIAGIPNPAATDLEASFAVERAAFTAANVDDVEMVCISDDSDVTVNVAYYRLGSAQ
jgi:hypothetical protein